MHHVVEVSRKSDHPFADSRLLLLDAPGNIHSVNCTLKAWSMGGNLTRRRFLLGESNPDRLFIYIGTALSANIDSGFSGLLVDLFSNGCLIPESQNPNTWMKMRKKLREDGRIMVNVGGSCVEAEDSRREGKVIMEETLKAMEKVFPGEVRVFNLGSRKDDCSIAVTGGLPDLDLWKENEPKSLRFYVDMWKPYTD